MSAAANGRPQIAIEQQASIWLLQRDKVMKVSGMNTINRLRRVPAGDRRFLAAWLAGAGFQLCTERTGWFRLIRAIFRQLSFAARFCLLPVLILLFVTTTQAADTNNSATVAPPSGLSDPDTFNNTSTDTDPITLLSDLVVTKNNGSATVNFGGQTTYVVRVTNDGPSPASGAILSDPVAVGLTKVSVTCSPNPGSCTAAPTPDELESGTFVLPPLAPGAFFEILIEANVTVASGQVANLATASVPTGWIDPVPLNNSDTDKDSVSVPPVAANDTLTGLPTGTPAVVTVLANDSDVDGTVDPATVVFTDPAATNGGKTLSVPGEGMWTVDPSGVMTFTAETGFTGNPTPATYTVADNDGNVSSPATVTLTFTPVPPVAANDTLTGLPTGTPAVVTVLGNDSDPDGTLDPATVMFTDPAATNGGKTLSVPGEGVWAVGPSGVMTFTPETGFTGNPTPVTIRLPTMTATFRPLQQ